MAKVKVTLLRANKRKDLYCYMFVLSHFLALKVLNDIDVNGG